MQEHPIPQNVTGYEFHLIGQMTLKQFLEVAAGILIAVLINTTNLPQVIKVPCMILSALTGAAIAFVPLEGRPLDRWFIAFIKSIYQPTLYFWKKSDTTPPVFAYTPPRVLDTSVKVDLSPLRKTRVTEYLSSMQTPKQEPDEDATAVASVLALFSSPQTPLPATTPTLSPTSTSTSPTTLPTPSTISAPLPSQSVPVFSAPPVPAHPPSTTEEKVVIVPKSTPISVEKTATPIPSSITTPVVGQLQEVFSQESTSTSLEAKPAVTDTSLPFPTKPTQPNMVVGMVMGSDNKIVENAIVTILRKSDGTPMRALRTNSLGQFSIATPLESGEYVLSVEHDGYHFDNASISLNNQVLGPILVKARP